MRPKKPGKNHTSRPSLKKKAKEKVAMPNPHGTEEQDENQKKKGKMEKRA